jgi:transcription initiation factor TFIIH subunit 4
LHLALLARKNKGQAAEMQSIFDFIGAQSSALVNKIYGSHDDESIHSPWACRAIFQSLSALSKNFVLRLIYIDGPIRVDHLREWVTSDAHRIFTKTIEEMQRLRILEENLSVGDSTNCPHYQINPNFKRSLKFALCHPIEPWSNTAEALTLKPDKKAPMKDELDSYCSEKWEDMLRFMVNIPTLSTIDSTVENFLRCTGLMADGPDERGVKRLMITSDGYEYMLKDHQSQVLRSV